MNWLSLITRSPSEQYLNQVAQRVASHCRHAVWQRVGHRTGTMTPHEARGYINARSATIVDRQVKLEIEQDRRLNASHQDKITKFAIAAVVQMIQVQTRVINTASVRPRHVA